MPTTTPGLVKPVLVLGLGNLLLTDDGFGPTLLERLRNGRQEDPQVDYVDGGTMGLGLLSLLSGRSAVLILDAFCANQRPGTLLVKPNIEWNEVGAIKGRSAHEGNAAGLLAVAALTGDLPGRIAVIGVEPELFSTGIGLSRPLLETLDEAEMQAKALIEELTGAVACV
jgi:hydrogenase maturation protease